MHRLSIAALLVASLALPGCIFAYGTDRDDWDDDSSSTSCCNDCAQMEHAEHRLAVIEAHLKHECKANCPYCKAEAPAAGEVQAKPATK
jgi:hypothetical protein